MKNFNVTFRKNRKTINTLGITIQTILKIHFLTPNLMPPFQIVKNFGEIKRNKWAGWNFQKQFLTHQNNTSQNGSLTAKQTLFIMQLTDMLKMAMVIKLLYFMIVHILEYRLSLLIENFNKTLPSFLQH